MTYQNKGSKVKLEEKYNSNGKNLEQWKCYRCNIIFGNESIAKLHEDILKHRVYKIKSFNY